MSLTPPEPREAIHTRAIEINGYRRIDGLYDIEAHLTDTKTFGQTNFDRGYIPAGEPIHDMWLRLTIDDTMHIVAVDAVSDRTPYVMCPTAAPNFARLVGLRIRLPQFAIVTVSESWLDGRQHVDVRLRSPLLGEWFRYAGSFSYRSQER